MDQQFEVQVEQAKAVWTRPELQRLEAGSAESNFAGTPDNSAPQAS